MELEYTGEMKKLSLSKGDIIVVKSKKQLTKDQQKTLGSSLKDAFPNNKVLIMNSDQFEMEVVEPLKCMDDKTLRAWNILAGRCIPFDHIEANGDGGFTAYGVDAKPLAREYDQTELAQAIIDVYNTYKGVTDV